LRDELDKLTNDEWEKKILSIILAFLAHDIAELFQMTCGEKVITRLGCGI
jgi:hypothetical protein